VSDGPSPRACLTDFDFITTILEPGRKFLYAAESAGGAMQFMSPELLELSIIDEEQAISTPQADIYAFGSTIFQVCEQDRGHRPFLFTLPSGSYRWGPIPSYSGFEGEIQRASWGAPGETNERPKHRIFRFAMDFCPALLATRGGAAAKDWGCCSAP